MDNVRRGELVAHEMVAAVGKRGLDLTQLLPEILRGGRSGELAYTIYDAPTGQLEGLYVRFAPEAAVP